MSGRAPGGDGAARAAAQAALGLRPVGSSGARTLARSVSLAAGLGVALASCGPREPARIRFEEVAPETSGFRFRHELPGGRLDNLPKSVMGGFAAFDYDGDGHVDIYMVNGGWHPELAGAPRPASVARNRLFRNLGAMRFADVTDAAGVGDEGFGLGAAVGDFDGDGHVDLFVSNYGRSVLYRNRGDGTFEDVTERAGVRPGLHAGACFLDYDRDGWLDLFVGQYVDVDDTEPGMVHMEGSFPGPAAYKGQPPTLYRNRGDGTFEDVTGRAGILVSGRAMGVVASDLDDDGWVDLVVANDAMPNHVWRNRGDGTFVEAAATLGMAFGADGDDRASMGVTVADVDGDGRLDYLVPDTRGGAVYVSAGRHYRDRAGELGFSARLVGLVGWTDVALDADNDGLLDLYKAHGDLRTLRPQPSFLLHNQGAEGFEPVAPLVGGAEAAAGFEGAARGALAVDLDDDGREDLVVLVLDGRARLYRNVTQNAGNWVRVELVGRPPNRLALGARVWGRVGKRRVVREVSGSTGYVSGGDLRQHFGLGAEGSLTDVRVRWPTTGEVREYGSLRAGRTHRLEE